MFQCILVVLWKCPQGTRSIGIRLVDFVGAVASIVDVECISALLWDGKDSSSNFTSWDSMTDLVRLSHSL